MSGTAIATNMAEISQCSCCQDGAVIPAQCPRCGKPTNVRVVMGDDECVGNIAGMKRQHGPGPMVPLGLKTRKDKSSKKSSDKAARKKTSTARQDRTEGMSPVPETDSSKKDNSSKSEDAAMHQSAIHAKVSEHLTCHDYKTIEPFSHIPTRASNTVVPNIATPRPLVNAKYQQGNFSQTGHLGYDVDLIANGMGGDDISIRSPGETSRQGNAGSCIRCGHEHKNVAPCHPHERRPTAFFSPQHGQVHIPGNFKQTAFGQADPPAMESDQWLPTDPEDDTFAPKVFWKRSRTGDFGILTAVGVDGEKYGLRIPIGKAVSRKDLNVTSSTAVKPPTSLFQVAPSIRRDPPHVLFIFVVLFLALTIGTYVFKNDFFWDMEY